MKTIRPNRKWAVVSALLLCVAGALIVPWRVVAQKMTTTTLDHTAEASTPAELDLLRKEIELARRHVQSEEKLLEVGRTIPQTLLERQRELVLLQQELAKRENDWAAQEQLLRDALAQTTRLLREQKRRVELGTLPPESELGFEREVVRLERELHALRRSPATNMVRALKGAGGRQVQLSSQVAGIITEVLVRPGGKVKKGDVLLRFDDREAKVKLDAALSQVAGADAALKIEEMEVEHAQVEYRRMKELFDEKLVSERPPEMRGPRGAEARLAKSRADLKFAQAQADLARLAVESLALHAPRDGIVSAVRVIEGEYVSVGGKSLVIIEP